MTSKPQGSPRPYTVCPDATYTSWWPGDSPIPTLFMDQVIQVLPGVTVRDFGSPRPSGLCSKITLLEGYSLTTYIKAHLQDPHPSVLMSFFLYFLSFLLSFILSFFTSFLSYLFLWYLSIPDMFYLFTVYCLRAHKRYLLIAQSKLMTSTMTRQNCLTQLSRHLHT